MNDHIARKTFSVSRQDLLAQIKDLEASCASLERERVETSRVLNSLKEELNGPDTNAVLARRASQQKEQELLEVGPTMMQRAEREIELLRCK